MWDKAQDLYLRDKYGVLRHLCLTLLLSVVTAENDKGSNDFLYLISDGMSVQCRDYGLGDHPSRK